MIHVRCQSIKHINNMCGDDCFQLNLICKPRGVDDHN